MKNFNYTFDQLRDTDENLYKRFMSFTYNTAHGGVHPSEYFTADSGAISAETEESACENLYRIYNTSERPEHYHGPSMSVSDIVTLTDSETGVKSLWYCDSVGFKQIDESGEEI